MLASPRAYQTDSSSCGPKREVVQPTTEIAATAARRLEERVTGLIGFIVERFGCLVRGHDWYDFEAKYLDDACEFDIPAQLPAEQTARVRELACRAFTALDCAGLARVDFFVTDAGAVIVNEVNTMPGFTPISMFPRMWAATGVEYPALVDRLIAAALRRGAA